ncbi:MAG: FliA/WhiG family RNA polymerase sigma factor [Syntrophaceae bacterium]|nr:FliA/WhiG family RNA polymerase sigma factor [Syntrophaceae bacterium]
MEPLNSLTAPSWGTTVDKKERERLIMQYVPLVKNIVGRIAMKLPSHVGKDDLINAGIIGLMSALEKFDEGRNVLFETYAGFRIRGAILDELRSRDVVSRSDRNKKTRLEEALEELQKELGRSPTEEEIAAYLDMPLDDYYRLLNDAKGVSILSSDDLPPDYCETHTQSEVLEQIAENNPFALLSRTEMKEVLRDAIESLPEKEGLVLSLYYYEELTLKEIGLVMELSESRISQLHSQAVLRLRSVLKKLRYDAN